MVDPVNITNYKLSDDELEEVLLFWVAVAGKTAKTTSGLLEAFLKELSRLCGRRASPFLMIRKVCKLYGNISWLPNLMKDLGFGCYTHKARAFLELAYSRLNLRTCSVDDLEKIHGIGFKTSRCFVMHSRKNARCAGLDTHILHYMADLGYEVPRQTPSSKKQYQEIEQQFVKLADKSGMSVADFDLKIWKEYSGN